MTTDSSRLTGKAEAVVDPKEIVEEERLLIQVKDVHKELAPAREGAYSPEVRKLAESLAQMFPNTPVSYLLHRY